MSEGSILIWAVPMIPMIEETDTIWPSFCSIMYGRNAFKVQKCARVLTPKVLV